MRIAVAAAGVLLVFGMAGCSAGASVGAESGGSAGPAADPASSQVRTYTSETYGYSFEYGPPFEQQDDVSTDASGGGSASESAAVFDVDGTQIDGQYRDAFVVNVYELNAEITEEDLDQVRAELEESVLPQLERSSDSMEVGELEPVTVAGLPGYRADARFVIGDTPMESTLYFVFDKAVEYQLLTQAASDRWAELEDTFGQMVDSFRVA